MLLTVVLPPLLPAETTGATLKHHPPPLQEIRGVVLTIVCNRTLASSRAAADQFGIAGATDSWRAVVQDPGVDAVVIGTW